ncbi:PfkB family carbohydrate kinase, partial [Pseudonocardia pini]|uniref:PfkB family carbohydrate kinase n=1 Tax=Pseudonocardia pini TaxID=2758030 RepID=UPI0015F106E4
MSAEPVVLVIGSVNTDLIVDVVDLPRPGSTVSATGHRHDVGGKGANQAIAAATAGARTRFAGRVGDDAAAGRVLAGLRAAGVDTALVESVSGRDTGSALVSVDRSGENAIVVLPGANAAMSPDDVLRWEDEIESATVVVCQGELPPETVAATLRAAARLGTRAVCNLAPVLDVPDAVLATADPLVLNEHEARDLLGRPTSGPRSAAEALHERLGCVVVVTAGAAGAVLAG